MWYTRLLTHKSFTEFLLKFVIILSISFIFLLVVG